MNQDLVDVVMGPLYDGNHYILNHPSMDNYFCQYTIIDTAAGGVVLVYAFQ